MKSFKQFQNPRFTKMITIKILISFSFVLVSNASPEANTKNLIYKLKTYVNENHDGNYYQAFHEFDKNNDYFLNSGEIKNALKKIGVGNMITRMRWVTGIMNILDTYPTDGALDFYEIFEQHAPKFIDPICDTICVRGRCVEANI